MALTSRPDRCWSIRTSSPRSSCVKQELAANDFERRQNDTWIAASALSYDPPLPIVTANLDDFHVLAAADPRMLLVHPDLT